MANRFSKLIRKQLSYIILVFVIATLAIILSAYSTVQPYNFYTATPTTSIPEIVTIVPTQVYVSSTDTLPPTTTTTLPDLSGIDFVELARLTHSICGEHYDTAIRSGWTPEEWPKLQKIMYRESRCLPNACSPSDSGRVCRDWGLMQINEYSWRRHIISQGYQMSDMHDPYLNLKFARWIYELEVSNRGTGWGAWKLPPKS